MTHTSLKQQPTSELRNMQDIAEAAGWDQILHDVRDELQVRQG
jgi:hypothetical protein